ncbi:MAG: prepilin-type N-terminal cleavage/methylation domain-containing protein [Clostridia bacterium]|nr:prepilin-type N-terminal cleavage/methylation domain-containing protein [Clostridia bacterium]
MNSLIRLIKSNKGLTLMELLVAFVIITLLSSMVLFATINTTKSQQEISEAFYSANFSDSVANIFSVVEQKQLESWYLDASTQNADAVALIASFLNTTDTLTFSGSEVQAVMNVYLDFAFRYVFASSENNTDEEYDAVKYFAVITVDITSGYYSLASVVLNSTDFEQNGEAWNETLGEVIYTYIVPHV